MNTAASSSGVLGRLLAALGAAILLVLGFMFSVVLLALVVALGLVAFGYFWWKTRALREHQAQAAAQEAKRGAAADGRVIDGEAVIVEETRTVHRIVEVMDLNERRPPG